MRVCVSGCESASACACVSAGVRSNVCEWACKFLRVCIRAYVR